MTFNTRNLQEGARKQVEVALHDPHGAAERFDWTFPLLFQCSRCNRIDQAERIHIHEAIRVHVSEDCPQRHVAADDPVVVRVFYPKQP